MGKGIHDHYSYTSNEVYNIQQHDCMQPSNKCSTNLVFFNGLSQLWMLVFCPKLELSLWHAESCLEGLCSNCGIDNLKICLEELISNQLVQWKSIGYEVLGKTNDKRDKKAQKLEYHESHPIILLEHLKPHPKEFILHNYIAQWQEMQFRQCLENPPSNTIFSYVDFSKNYIMKIQNEVLNMHWHNF